MAFFAAVSQWADCVGPDRGGDNESFGIMDRKWIKRSVWALDDCFVAFNEVEDVHAALSVMGHNLGEPVPARFDKLPLMQAGPFFAPTIPSGEGGNAVD
jgi:hypothetical protein